MINHSDITFQEVLEIIESFPEKQQEDLINIIHKRIIEHKRETLAKSIKVAKEEYSSGEIKEGTIEDLNKHY